jgi:nitrate/nitrite transporter NarK
MDILVARLGGTLNSWLTPFLYNVSSSFFLPLLIGLFLCIFSFFCGLVMFYMDRESDIRERKTQNLNRSETIKYPMQIRDIKKFDLRFWLLVINCMMIYGAFFSFTGNANSILSKFFNVSNDTAGMTLIVFYLSSAFATPFFGILADKFGKRSFSISVSAY